MNYPQFFAVLANQCARFAPDVEVPPEMERVLSELSRATSFADVDPHLVKPFTALLGPIYRDTLTQAFLGVQKVVAERISSLDAAKEKLHADRMEAIRVAQEREAAATKAIMADREKISILEQQLAAVQNRLKELGK